MKIILIVTIIFLSLSAFAQGNTGHVHLVDSTYAILRYDTTDYLYTILFENAKGTVLSKEDIKQTEVLINSAIDEYNHQFNNAKFKNLLIQYNYKVQLVAVINSKGEEEVWANCLCAFENNWRKEIIQVRDGGSCYFNLKINLSKNKHYDMMVNGEA